MAEVISRSGERRSASPGRVLRGPRCPDGMLLFALLACVDPGFYADPVADLDAALPGDVLRSEPIAHVSAGTISWKAGIPSTHGARVYRLLYRTIGVDGAPDVASARLAIPDDAAPGDSLPLVAHLHGTLGLADPCAPSREPGFGFESAGNPNAAHMIAEGRVVVAPDYLGLGTPGPHPYTARVPVATSVLDAIRAAERFVGPDGGLGPPTAVALEGHSQGGQAVLATMALASTYAPELPIVGAVAIAAPGAPAPLAARVVGEDEWSGFVALSLLGLVDAHPELGALDQWLAVADTLSDRAETECLAGLGDIVSAPAADLFWPDVALAIGDGDFVSIGLADALAAEDIGDTRLAGPVLVVHGTADPLLPIELTEDLAERLRAAGSDVEFLPIEGGDHLMLPWTAPREVWEWLDGVL